jgi:uncharacterized protein YjeT (DUF2065 family)
VDRAKLVLRIVGICLIAIGLMMLPFPLTPDTVTRSLYDLIATTGFFIRPGLVVIGVGIGCLAADALMPEGRE